MQPHFSPILAAAASRSRPSRFSPASASCRTVARRFLAPCKGFTLVELLTVIAVVVILVALVTPAFTQISAARQLPKAAYDITGTLENARAYAKANSTYTWVGFFEEGASGTAGTAGIGRVVVSAVASRDATAMYTSSDTNPPTLNPSNLTQLGKLLKIDNLHLATIAPGDIPARGKVFDASGAAIGVPATYQVGDATPPAPDNFATRSGAANTTTFPYPLGVASPTYTFVKVIQFNPLGDATKIVDTPTLLMEIGLRIAHGNVVDTATKNCAAIQVSGIGGQARIYQP